MQDPALWSALKAHPLPVQGQRLGMLGLIRRVGRWGARHSAATLEEYRRFLYLAAVAGTEVVPPPILHCVWQMHARDHQHYTVDLVRGVIGRPMPNPFDLPPPLGDPAHARTRELYRREFGHRAPRVLWPTAPAMLFRRGLDLAIPALGILAALMLLSQYLAWAAVAVLAVLAGLLARDRMAPWRLRKRDTDVDLYISGNYGDGGGDLFGGND